MVRAGETDESAVQELGDAIGYGALMHHAEKLWRARLVAQGFPGGGEHTVGPCAAFMVPCLCPEDGRDAAGHCEWCCGSKRVTERVRAAMQAGATPPAADGPLTERQRLRAELAARFVAADDGPVFDGTIRMYVDRAERIIRDAVGFDAQQEVGR